MLESRKMLKRDVIAEIELLGNIHRPQLLKLIYLP